MIGIIVTGHGNFATGMTSALKLIGGEQEHYQAVDFLSEYSVEDLERELDKAMTALKDCDGILVLADLVGGSPFKTSVMMSTKRENIEVVGGCNLGMLMEVAMSRAFNDDLKALAESAVTAGVGQCVHYVFQAVEEETMEDGI